MEINFFWCSGDVFHSSNHEGKEIYEQYRKITNTNKSTWLLDIIASSHIHITYNYVLFNVDRHIKWQECPNFFCISIKLKRKAIKKITVAKKDIFEWAIAKMIEEEELLCKKEQELVLLSENKGNIEKWNKIIKKRIKFDIKDELVDDSARTDKINSFEEVHPNSSSEYVYKLFRTDGMLRIIPRGKKYGFLYSSFNLQPIKSGVSFVLFLLLFGSLGFFFQSEIFILLTSLSKESIKEEEKVVKPKKLDKKAMFTGIYRNKKKLGQGIRQEIKIDSVELENGQITEFKASFQGKGNLLKNGKGEWYATDSFKIVFRKQEFKGRAVLSQKVSQRQLFLYMYNDSILDTLHQLH